MQLGRRPQLARELDQRAPVIIAVLVEVIAVELLANPRPDRLKHERRDQDHEDHGQHRQLARAAHREQQPVEDPHHGQRRQRVYRAFLEDDVDVHQPVAQNRVSPRQRDEHERQHRPIHGGRRRYADRVGQGIDHGERQHADQRAVAQPGQLPPYDRVACPPHLVSQHDTTRQVSRAQETEPHPVQQPAHLDQRRLGPHPPERESQVDRQQRQRGHIHQERRARSPDPLLRLRKRAAEMQEHGRSQIPRHHVPQVDHLVEIIELARVVERHPHERSHAQQEEMRRPRSAPAPQVHKHPDRQVHRAHRVQEKQRPVPRSLADHDVGRDLHPPVQDLVFGLAPGPERRQHLRRVAGRRRLESLHGNQRVAHMDAGRFRRAPRSHMHRHRTRDARDVLVLPGHAVVGQAELPLLLKVDRSGDDGRHGHDHQQRTLELFAQLSHAVDTAPRVLHAGSLPNPEAAH